MNDMATNYNMDLENLVNELPARYVGVVPVYASVFDVVGFFPCISWTAIIYDENFSCITKFLSDNSFLGAA
jgi:hypothetical protein